jgi:hypothetical protein
MALILMSRILVTLIFMSPILMSLVLMNSPGPFPLDSPYVESAYQARCTKVSSTGRRYSRLRYSSAAPKAELYSRCLR